jgi:DNA-directed RNA polymerase specialized sigma24 family protein
VNRVAGHLRGQRDVAEEAAALAWVQLLRCQPHRGPRLFGWLFVVAKHEAYRLLREQARELPDHSPETRIDHTGSGDPFQHLARCEQLALIAQLPARQRLALGLYVRGYSYREISAATGKTYTWVNRHITEGRAAVRELARQLDK